MSNRHRDLLRPSTDAVGILRELIDALDRRVPRVERAGEAQIALDAAALKTAALNRIEELTRTGLDDGYDQVLAEAVMSDDGPARA